MQLLFTQSFTSLFSYSATFQSYVTLLTQFNFFSQHTNVLTSIIFSEGSKLSASLLLTGNFGVVAANASMNIFIEVFYQACCYIQFISPSMYSQCISVYSELCQIQVQIIGSLTTCSQPGFFLFYSCGPSYYLQFSQFIYKFYMYFNQICISWVSICSVDPDFCIDPPMVIFLLFFI